jgi:Carboxypeptidase regulatory-like domain/Matrixin
MDRVLASTSFITDETTGEILESDIFLNSEFAWSVSAAGESGKYDVQSIALHETGHLSGLGHSALGETQLDADGSRAVIASDAIMFPIAYAAGSVAGRTLRADDIAGISSLYPDGGVQQADGSISGHVTRNGQPLYGAHVVAFDPATQTMVAGFTLNAQGQFSISGLSPGIHVLRVEPLDDADVDSFFDESVTPVDVDFRVTYADHLIVVPRGGDSGDVAVGVLAK